MVGGAEMVIGDGAVAEIPLLQVHRSIYVPMGAVVGIGILTSKGGIETDMETKGVTPPSGVRVRGHGKLRTGPVPVL